MATGTTSSSRARNHADRLTWPFGDPYTTLNRRPPAEADMQAFFGVTPPSVRQMVLALERRQLIRRTPRVARSIELLVPPASLPLLEPP